MGADDPTTAYERWLASVQEEAVRAAEIAHAEETFFQSLLHLRRKLRCGHDFVHDPHHRQFICVGCGLVLSEHELRVRDAGW